MKVKYIIDEDFINYKKASMFIGCNHCNFKCNKDAGHIVCQNYSLLESPSIEISIETLIDRYLKNPITKAIVFGGLEPFDQLFEIEDFIQTFREYYNCDDDIVIYTGYTEEELRENSTYKSIINQSNIIIKYGRFRVDDKPIFDEVLGVSLASTNQYAIKYN